MEEKTVLLSRGLSALNSLIEHDFPWLSIYIGVSSQFAVATFSSMAYLLDPKTVS